MLQKELYKKSIEREVNPAVSASDMKPDVVNVEIDEYVFTDEIVIGLYEVINGIKNANVSHNGIWINGFYGSGKSHFLKYLRYLFHKEYANKAFDRLVNAVKECNDKDFGFAVSNVDIANLRNWVVDKANIEIVMFNIGSVHNARANDKNTFTEVFWSEYNRHRGFNQFSLPLAQYIEKPLSEAGKFEEFKAMIPNWDRDAGQYVNTELDLVLEAAKDVLPTLSIDAIRNAIVNDTMNVSVESFATEMARYAENKGEDFRLLFLVDEVSQFIDSRKGLLLQLQEVATELNNKCNGSVWVACTAQQDLSQVVAGSQIRQTDDAYGKIMGRFTIKVSLSASKPEYITKVRLLEKNGSGEACLADLYKKKKSALETQFQLPTSFNAYDTQADFIDFYPFLPYQFKLIKLVLDNLVDIDFIDKQQGGTERSIIKVAHTTAKLAKDEEVGSLISFDKFYDTVIRGSLTALGQRAISNGLGMVEEIEDDTERDFARRVIEVLFLICHLQDSNKLVFPATLYNVVTLLMQRVDDSRNDIKTRVENVLDYLCTKNIIRREIMKGNVEVYDFYTEDEREVAATIDNQTVDPSTMAEELRKLIHGYLPNISNKKTFYTRNASIGEKILGRGYMTVNNPDMWIHFEFEDEREPEVISFGNRDGNVIFYMSPDFRNKKFYEDFYWYCKVQKYVSSCAQTTLTPSRQKAKTEFEQRASTLFNTKIKSEFKAIFDKCVIIAGQDIERGITNSGPDRYEAALTCAFDKTFRYAHLASGSAPRNQVDLATAINRPYDENEYKLMPPTDAENQVDNYLSRKVVTVDMQTIISDFERAPYGWSEYFTAYTVNELCRRRLWKFLYANNPQVETKFVAQNLMREKQKFTLKRAESISPELITRFTASWKKAINIVATLPSDGEELMRTCKESLEKMNANLSELIGALNGLPFCHFVEDARNIVAEWKKNSDAPTFFNKVINAEATAKETFDKYKAVKDFYEQRVKSVPGRPSLYVEIVDFIRNNRDNFSYLSDTERNKANELQAILTDEWPMDKMRAYGKLRDELRNDIASALKNLRAEITTAINTVYDEMEQMVADKNLDGFTLPSKDSAIARMTIGTESISKLRNELNEIDTLKERLIHVINAEIQQRAAKSVPTGSGEDRPTPVVKQTRTAYLPKPKNGGILHTETEVNEYIENLRQTLMTYINNNEDVLIK